MRKKVTFRKQRGRGGRSEILFQNAFLKWNLSATTPSAALSVASLLFIDAAATPPHEEGNVPSNCDFLCKAPPGLGSRTTLNPGLAPGATLCRRSAAKNASRTRTIFFIQNLAFMAYYASMEVRLFYNSIRPGVGMKPRREGQRPLLPQHARHCPVLEGGSARGVLVYPALTEKESFHIEFQGEGRYQFIYSLSRPNGDLEPIVSVTVVLPMGSIGMIREDVSVLSRKTSMNRNDALRLIRTFIVPEDLGTPPGAISLRGATNFQTPPGWDPVYTPIFNMIERPVAPMLVIRVETDWYAHETEFRYVVQPGEGISATHTMPIGQVF